MNLTDDLIRLREAQQSLAKAPLGSPQWKHLYRFTKGVEQEIDNKIKYLRGTKPPRVMVKV